MKSQLSKVRANLVGRTVVKVNYLTPKEALECGRSGHILVLTLDNGVLVLVPVDGNLNDGEPR